MTTCFRRLLFLACLSLVLASCGNKETKEALRKSKDLQTKKQYEDANEVLVAALRVREAKVRADNPAPTDKPSNDALTLKVQSDPEILKMERAQILIYLQLQRADLASAVYTDIQSGNPGDSVVNDLLKNDDPVVRTGAVQTLGLAGKPESFDELVKATSDTDKDVRRSAVAALGAMKDPRVVDPLLAALKDSYWFVRSEAAAGLGRTQDARAIKPLLDAVGDSDTNVESSAENSLVGLCAIPNLAHDDFVARLNDPNSKLVIISAACLAVLKDPQAPPVLEKLAASPDAVMRLHAVKALGETGDSTVLPTLRQTLKDPDINVRGWSVIGLGRMKDAASLADLQAIAADANQSARMRAAATAAVNAITGTPATANGP